MRRLLPIFALLAFACWAPAAERCALEAAGLFPKTCPDVCMPGHHCSDGCDTVEDGFYKPAVDTLKVLAPDLLACTCHLCLRLIQSDVVREIAPIAAASFERPQKWVTTWHFVRRAAPSPRAPCLLCA